MRTLLIPPLVSWRTVAPDGTVTLEGQNFFEFEDG